MIKVVITGPPSGTGYLPYRIEWWAAGRPQFVGLSREPLLDACRQLQQYGLMDDTVVGLFEKDAADRDEWLQRTTVGYGARAGQDRFKSEAGRGIAPIQENEPAGLALDAGVPTQEERMGPYREFPGGPIKQTDRPGELRDDRRDVSAAPPARSEAEQPKPHKPPEPPDDTGPGPSKPSKPHQSHHQPKLKGSGGRRGSRSGR